jgi:hypothetical protein
MYPLGCTNNSITSVNYCSTRQLRSRGPNLEPFAAAMENAATARGEDDKELGEEFDMQMKRNFLAQMRGFPGDQVILRYLKNVYVSLK